MDGRRDESARKPAPPRGDEAALFEEFNAKLTALVARKVNTSPDIIDDAVAFAWAQFLRYQPDRRRGWRAWLVVTAEHEAYRLHRKEAVHDPMELVSDYPQGRNVRQPADPHDALTERLALREALNLLGQVPERRRRAKSLHVTGLTYDEIAAVMGISRTRVDHLIREAHDLMRSAREATGPQYEARTERAARLAELEESQPPWIVSAIGPMPSAGHSPQVKLLWRRAALALDDYQRATGRELLTNPLGQRPTDPAAVRAYDLAATAAARFQRVRSSSRAVSDCGWGANSPEPPAIER
jgi:RNA polymerase sigma factor (sigma-70 family)